MNNANPWISK